MSRITEREYEQYRSQIRQLEGEWQTKEDQIKVAISNEEDNLCLIQEECMKLNREQDRYYEDPQLMALLEQKNEQLNQARYEEEQILEDLYQERRNLDNQMEGAIGEIRRMMY